MLARIITGEKPSFLALLFLQTVWLGQTPSSSRASISHLCHDGWPWMVPQGPSTSDNTLTLISEMTELTPEFYLHVHSSTHSSNQQIFFEHLSLCQTGCQCGKARRELRVPWPASSGSGPAKRAFPTLLGHLSDQE